MGDEVDPELRAKLKGFRWKRVMCLDTDEGGIIQDRCEPLKLNRVTFTPRKKGRWGTPQVNFTIDGIEEDFASVLDAAKVLDALGMIPIHDVQPAWEADGNNRPEA